MKRIVFSISSRDHFQLTEGAELFVIDISYKKVFWDESLDTMKYSALSYQKKLQKDSI